MKEPLRVTIRRSKWIKGRLMDEQGRCCALGHVARACGIPDEELIGAGTYLAVKEEFWEKLPEKLRPTALNTMGLLDTTYVDSVSAATVTYANDSEAYDVTEKETRLTRLLHPLDIYPIFID